MLCHFGYSFGSMRHWMPPTVTYRMPLMTSRISRLRGRPPNLAKWDQWLDKYPIGCRSNWLGIVVSVVSLIFYDELANGN